MTDYAGTRDFFAGTLDKKQITLSKPQKDAVRSYLANKLPADILNPFARNTPNRRERINEALAHCIKNRTLLAGVGTEDRYRQDWTKPTEELIEALYAQVVGLDVLQPLLDDLDITSITVLDCRTILYEKRGQIYESPTPFASREEMVEVIRNFAIRGGQQLTPARPTADLQFPPPEIVRVHLSTEPVTAYAGGFLALRRGRTMPWTLEMLVAKGVMNDEMAAFLRSVMSVPFSCIVGGPPSSGKTTVMEVLLGIPKGQHISLLEQSAELNPNNRYISRFEVPPGTDTVSLATLTIDSLRKNTEIVVIGETRGSEAGWLLFIAGGVAACITTLHGRTSQYVVNRMASNAQIMGDPPVSPYVGNQELAKQAVVDAFDFVIHAVRLSNGQRIINSIEYIKEVNSNGEIELVPVYTAQLEVVKGVDGVKLGVTWLKNPEWEWPKDLVDALEMASLRSDISMEDVTDKVNQLHGTYKRACVALDQRKNELALRLLVEVLKLKPNGYLDSETRLRQCLKGLGRWTSTVKQARATVVRFNQLIKLRKWRDLEAALQQAEDQVELRVAINTFEHTLSKYQKQVTQGLHHEGVWRNQKNNIDALIQQVKHEEALEILRRVPLGWLNKHIQEQVRVLKMSTMQHLITQDVTPLDKKLTLCYEMRPLINAETEQQLMRALDQRIAALEKESGAKPSSKTTKGGSNGRQ